MSLSPELRGRITALVQSNSVVLFMKGSRHQPGCGFSASVVGMLGGLISDYETFDVLSDPEMREGIKEFSNWPTIPQLYVKGEFMGGCDIVQEMFASGELHKALGVERVDPIKPTISITDAAAQVLEQARSQQGADGGLHISVSPSFGYSLRFGPQRPGEVAVEANGWQVYVENDSTRSRRRSRSPTRRRRCSKRPVPCRAGTAGCTSRSARASATHWASVRSSRERSQSRRTAGRSMWRTTRPTAPTA